MQTGQDAADLDSGPAPAISVVVDGKSMELAAGNTLQGLVKLLGHEQGRVATALNGQFVPLQARAATTLATGDAVLLFQPIVGG